MRKEMTMKEKRFSFFADPQKRIAESLHTSQRFAKAKEPIFTLSLMFLVLTILLFTNTNAYSQSEKISTQNLIGCWQTIKYVTENEEIVYPKEIKMIYKFYCDGTYEMLISNDNTNQSKYQKGKFTYNGKMISVIIDGGDEPIKDNLISIDANNEFNQMKIWNRQEENYFITAALFSYKNISKKSEILGYDYRTEAFTLNLDNSTNKLEMLITQITGLGRHFQTGIAEIKLFSGDCE